VKRLLLDAELDMMTGRSAAAAGDNEDSSAAANSNNEVY